MLVLNEMVLVLVIDSPAKRLSRNCGTQRSMRVGTPQNVASPTTTMHENSTLFTRTLRVAAHVPHIPFEPQLRSPAEHAGMNTSKHGITYYDDASEPTR